MSGKILAFLGRVNWFPLFIVSATIALIFTTHFYQSDDYKKSKCEQYGHKAKIDKDFRIYCDVEWKNEKRI